MPYSLVIERLSKHFGRRLEVRVLVDLPLRRLTCDQEEDAGSETVFTIDALTTPVANDSSKDYP